MATKQKKLKLSRDAVALRPVRMNRKRNTFTYYEGTTFPRDPFGGCSLYLRRCDAFGYLVRDEGDLLIDVLNADGDIVQDFPVSRKGFEYLRRSLKFRREQPST